MSVQKKSLISTRSTAKKALVATSGKKKLTPRKIATPYLTHKFSPSKPTAVSTPNRLVRF